MDKSVSNRLPSEAGTATALKLRTALHAIAVTAICALQVACGSDGAPGRNPQDGLEFGIWVADAAGEPEFVATDEVPYVQDQAFGWRTQAVDGDGPVKWVERLRLPTSPRSWEGVAENPYVTVSPDGRTATTVGQAPPGEGFFGNVWYVELGDPAGDYEISVEIEDGRKARFRFRLTSPSGEAGEAAGEVI